MIDKEHEKLDTDNSHTEKKGEKTEGLFSDMIMV